MTIRLHINWMTLDLQNILRQATHQYILRLTVELAKSDRRQQRGNVRMTQCHPIVRGITVRCAGAQKCAKQLLLHFIPLNAELGKVFIFRDLFYWVAEDHRFWGWPSRKAKEQKVTSVFNVVIMFYKFKFTTHCL